MLQYVALFIVILAVMAAMNGFLFLMLRGLSRQLKEQVNSCFLRQLEFTDAIYEEKREKLNRLKEEENTFLGRASASPVKEQLDGPKETTVRTAAPVTVAVPAAAENDRQAGYINPSLIEDYRYIKEHFKVDTEEAYQNVMAEQPDQERIHHGNVCRHMYEILDFDTVYRIGLLAVPDEHEILYEIFDDDEDEVLRTYVAQHPDFLIVEFRDYLKMEADLCQDHVTVQAADEEFLKAHPEADASVDESLGEGIRVFRGSHMYDYSI